MAPFRRRTTSSELYAASEGLNLQETARYVFHWDVPWNPARLEQRNGRLDRQGQSRDVVVRRFSSDDDADLKFLAFERRLVLGDAPEAVQRDLDRGVLDIANRPRPPRDATVSAARAEPERLVALAAELDLDPDSLRQTLEKVYSKSARRRTVLRGVSSSGSLEACHDGCDFDYQ